ncbi:hypothetical protein HKX54_17795 [Sulfitobacter sp. M57]|nr:hypothetical protein [Sulfitobacter sp. KE43]MDF3434872.1 hypothetical protein [Sulfitobacter sp. KE42]MDF3460511.1 hypothetical protein [Sulfitobacter sp. S74]MDF3464409.1 hypothetical protein [Sulfitobacter sp. Ks18]MDF3468360.1 hypothetical protein [Sulfitobacter sp. M05]MDF3475953.1 hypothetical protein [Sulfitobacter sp. M48]MDF3479856.1 hypothetical protein [Sulfitobacter sp. M53]MDF3483754.1 hypothetical protein [Sulfitobacter sp. M24]MDF3487651.1 hypothetical protein [Sulfitobact
MRLLNRTTRSISATEAGKAYFERLRPLLDEYDHLDLADRVASQTLRGRLRLTEPLSFGVIEFAPALNDFALRYPEIKLDVIFSDRITNLVDEGFDMAIRNGRPADSRLALESSAMCGSWSLAPPLTLIVWASRTNWLGTPPAHVEWARTTLPSSIGN